jgi:ribosomal protein L32
MTENSPVGPWSLLNPNRKRASKELAKQRLDVCQNCDKFKPMTHQCGICNCFMNLKVQLQDSICPLQKW